MNAWLLLPLLASAAPPPQTFMPCAPGRTIEYRLLSGGKDTKGRVRDTVRGPHTKRQKECIVDRVTTEPSGEKTQDAWVFEDAQDRILDAGFFRSMTAFRPPLLVAPLDAGRRWRFNRTTYVVLEAKKTVKVRAGTFENCVVIGTMKDGQTKPVMRSTYAPGVGLIHVVAADRVREAIQTAVRKEPTAAETRGTTGP